MTSIFGSICLLYPVFLISLVNWSTLRKDFTFLLQHQYVLPSSPTVCMGDLPTVPSSLITSNMSSDFRYLNGTTNFTCPADMGTEANTTLQTITCSQENEAYVFLPNTISPCSGKAVFVFL